MLRTEEVKNPIGIYIEELLKRNKKEPFCAYLYNLKYLKEHARFVKKSLPSFCRLFYAIKANPDREILKILNEVVDGFEVASLGEIQKVQKITSKPIMMGAPAKKNYEIKEIVNGAVDLVNIESIHDLNQLQHWANSVNTIVPVIIRVNLKDNVSDSRLKMSGVPSQFGIDERLISQLLESIHQYHNLTVKGFHFHAMSNNLNADTHLQFVNLCIEKSLQWQKEYNIPLSVVNVGGGIGINYENPKVKFDWDKLTHGLHQLETKYGNCGFNLYLELGRYIVAECGFYAAEVLDIKSNNGKNFVLLRGGTHHLRLPAAWKINHPFTIHSANKWDFPFQQPMIQNKKVTIAGELCTPNDVLARDVHVTSLKVGDIIVFHFAGAYGWTISHHDFLSHPNPEVFYL